MSSIASHIFYVVQGIDEQQLVAITMPKSPWTRLDRFIVTPQIEKPKNVYAL